MVVSSIDKDSVLGDETVLVLSDETGLVTINETGLVLNGTSNDEDLKLGGETDLGLPGISGGRSFSFNSTKIPTCTDVITDSHTWSDWSVGFHFRLWLCSGHQLWLFVHGRYQLRHRACGGLRGGSSRTLHNRNFFTGEGVELCCIVQNFSLWSVVLSR